MQHVLTWNSHLQAKLRTIIALQGGCVHLGSHIAYNSTVNISHMRIKYRSKKHCKPYGIPNAHNHPVKQ